MFLPKVWHTSLQHIATPRSNSNKYRSTKYLIIFRIHLLDFPLGFHTNPRFHTWYLTIKTNHSSINKNNTVPGSTTSEGSIRLSSQRISEQLSELLRKREIHIHLLVHLPAQPQIWIHILPGPTSTTTTFAQHIPPELLICSG